MIRKDTSIDKFSQRRLNIIAERFRKGCQEIERATAFARLGFLVKFTDVDLVALNKAGLLTFSDRKQLQSMGRLPK